MPTSPARQCSPSASLPCGYVILVGGRLARFRQVPHNASLADSIAARSTVFFRCLSSTPAAFKKKDRRKRYDPFAEERSRQRRLAALARRQELEEARTANAADPVMGHITPFLAKIDEVPAAPLPLDATGFSAALPEQLNHSLGPQELPRFLEQSKTLAYPRAAKHSGIKDPYEDLSMQRAVEERHRQAVEAIKRIVSLGNGSSADRRRANTQLAIEEFGRHRTDELLPKDPGVPKPRLAPTPRVGPDTGSGEVQAAILTVKIRALKHALDNGGKKDVINKRNLRLLVHRRQKILKYLKHKEKGGVRYRNIMQALGLDDAAIEKELFM